MYYVNVNFYYIYQFLLHLANLILCSMCRLAFSCIWEMNHNAEILNTRFTKSVINSKVLCGILINLLSIIK